MQKKLPMVYLFIEDFVPSELDQLNKNISIIFRNYKKTISDSKLIKLKNYCKSHRKDLYLANDIKRAIKYKLSGAYIPAFNKKLNLKIFYLPQKFLLIGSAHNRLEIKIKEVQGCSLIFLSPVFKVNKKNNYLGVTKFNLLTLNQKSKFIALGGINETNFKQISLLRCFGFSGISWIKKNGLRNIRPFLNNLSIN